MKYILTAYILLSFAASAQDSWEWHLPQPTGHFYSDLQMLNNGRAVAVAQQGTFIQSDDYGYTWNYYYTGDLTYLEAVYFVNNDTGYVAGTTNYYNAPKMMKTTDGGLSWDTLATSQFNDIYCMHFINADTGWVAGLDGAIYRTNDGGQSWIDQSIVNLQKFNAMEMLSVDTGIAVSSSGGLYRTVNGGANWNTIGSVSGEMHDIFFLDDQRGWMTGASETIYATVNGGLNWQMQHYVIGATTAITSVIFLDSLHGFAASQPYLYRTSDGGLNWDDSNNFYHQAVSVDMDSTGAGIMTGIYGSIQVTADSGFTWTAIAGAANFYDYNAVTFTDPAHGWCVGDGAKIFRTTDGKSWTMVSGIPTGAEYNDVHFLNSQTGYVCGETGIVRKTINGGTSWTNVNTPGTQDLYSVFFLNATTGWVGGWTGTLFKTINGGTTWTQQTLPTFTYMVDDIFFTSADTGYIAAWGNKIYKTNNGGNTWIELSGVPSISDVMNIQFVNSTTGMISSGYGYFSKTTDGGLSWSTPVQFYFSPASAMHFYNEQYGFIAGGQVNWDEKMYRTNDGGLTWYNTHLPFAFKVEGLFMTDTNSVYLCGEYGNLLHYGDSIAPVIISVPDNDEPFSLEISPNPSSTQINIKCSVAVTAFTLTDLHGREILSGKYSATDIIISTWQLKNGVYLLTAALQNGEIVSEKILVNH